MFRSFSSEVTRSLRLALLGVLALGACTEPVQRTQVIVLVDADESVRDQIRYVDVEVRSGPANADEWQATIPKKLIPRKGAKSWPLSFSLSPPESGKRIGYYITATAKDADDGDLATVRALSDYVPGKSLVLRLRFDEACATRSEPCPTTFSCQQGQCIDPFVPASELPIATTMEAAREAPAPAATAGSDAPMPDAGRSSAMPQAGSGATAPGGCSGANCGSCPARDSKGACLPCPAGFLGDDPKSCSPGFISLEVPGSKLEPAFDPKTAEYTAKVPFLEERATVRYALPAGTELLIDGRAASGATEWKSEPLAIGRTEVAMTLTSNGAQSRTYTLVLERTLAQETHLASPFPSPGDAFGSRLAVSGDLIVVGAPYEDGSEPNPSGAPDDRTKDSGAAYLFERTASGWQHRAYLKSEMPREAARFGFSVAIDGTRFAVGAPYDANGGSVHVYEWRSGAAQLVSVLRPDSANAQFGRAMALQGERLVVGAPIDPLGGAQDTGALYVFEFAGGTWQRRALLKSETPGPLDWLGSGVAMDGDIIVGGATGRTVPNQSLPSGAAYVFERTADGWHQVQMLYPSKVESGAFFGESLAVKGSRIAVSGFFGSVGLSGGSVTLFERGSDGKWSEAQTVRAKNTHASDWFGGRVLLTDSLLLAGAAHESSATPGVGADGAGTLDKSGAVYVFSNGGGSWTQALQIKLTEPMEDQQFGFGLDLGEDGTLVAGVPADPNVNGSSMQAGGVYVFR